MTVQVQSSAEETAAFGSRALNLGWAIRRALLGLFILAVGIGSLAWLTHASIDPALEPAVERPR